MRILLTIILISACFEVLVCAQTAEELVAKNLQAKGGLEKIRAVKSLRMTGRMQQGQFVAQVGEEAKAPDLLRQNFTVEGMTAIQAYDGKTGWQVSPFEGRKDPELLGEDDLRDLVEQADFYGPLVDYQAKGNTVQYLGHDQVDGDDAYRLKVTLKNGDIIYYDLDPDTYMEIRTEKQQFIRGAVKDTVTDLGSYKQVNGVYYPFSIASGPKHDPRQLAHISLEKIEANVSIPDSEFAMPAAPPVPSPQQHVEPPPSKSKKIKPPKTKPPA
jgi:outer membrane lipoprotein-sorting protein